MKRSDGMQLVLVAAVWGASYLFIRIAAPAFGPVAMAGARALLAAAMMAPLLLWRGLVGETLRHWKGITLVGVTNVTLPFLLFNYAALVIPAGLSAILASTTPLFAALVGVMWLGERLTMGRMAGLAIGFGGVVLLVADKIHLQQGALWPTLAAAWACLCATLLYGFTGNFTRRYLAAVSPVAVAAGSQVVAAVLLFVPMLLAWPDAPPSTRAWSALLALCALCTTFIYVVFYGLIARLGASRAMSSLFLIPPFGVLWGGLFLGERFTLRMGASCAVILLGCALTTGLLRLRTPGSVKLET
ncbi:putative membrane protein [Pseudoduganella lurida]|uniref:Putative membrane protein n=1 Tax=Pseudoduganella lurida TaxID=1036180 RepID=A0A562RBV9_9BURK|nr:DMT family transporter [Pseudoduganella lurida]TWI66537.1 putative membrane protein [Pseudoduganella lurida]